MSRQRVAMQLLQRGVRADQARAALAESLSDAAVAEPDEFGIFEIELDASDHEAALGRVWDAVATSGSDDQIAFAEHPDIPEHWRRRPDAERR